MVQNKLKPAYRQAGMVQKKLKHGAKMA